MSFQDQIARGFAQAQSILGESFVLDGVTYAGTISEQTALDPLRPTGVDYIRQFVILATKDQFAAKPVAAGRPRASARSQSLQLVGVGEDRVHYTLTFRPL